MLKYLKRKKPAYIHIPKTGGTYLGQLENKNSPVISNLVYLGHCTIIDNDQKRIALFPPKVGYLESVTFNENIKNKFYIFSTVRNPYDWLVSYWIHSGGIKSKYMNKNHYDYQYARKGFNYFVKHIANRDGNIWPSRKFIFFALFSHQGHLLPKWVCRTENLDKDLYDFSKLRGLKYKKKPKQRVSIKRKDYKYYYNDKLIEIVRDTWKRELELFGYDFNGLNISKALLKRKISFFQRKKIKYIWESDELIIQNEVK